MGYRGTQSESRQQYLAKYNAAEASKYDEWISQLTADDHDACLADIGRVFQFKSGMAVLDAGAGTGALSLALARVDGLQMTSLEPCSAMSDLLVSKPTLSGLTNVQGFCDHRDDRSLFPESTFDVIASRQLANGLFDPLAAFRNWHFWLSDSGTVILMDGLFDRDAWSGHWDGVVDTLPLSACRTTATVPYLLEQTGFRIESVGLMESTNQLPSTRTPRYIVVATKIS